MKISIDEKGKLFVDGSEKDIATVDSEFLDYIVELGLKDEVEYEFKQDKNNPLVELFNSLKNITLPESDFRKELSRIEKLKVEEEEKLKNLEERIVESEVESAPEFTEEQLKDMGL